MSFFDNKEIKKCWSSKYDQTYEHGLSCLLCRSIVKTVYITDSPAYDIKWFNVKFV